MPRPVAETEQFPKGSMPYRAAAALAAEHSDKITIVQLHVDESPRTAAEYDVRSIPTLNVDRNGRVVKTVIGAKPRSALEQEPAGVPEVTGF
ncbi:thioredoxin (plasmid) [Streptomyces sp. NBC_01340]|uniref:thioredoxin domain-containing protein n=1 Tax=unclassified Streptomyces TaxID=2593676 RepID=UPI002254B108|nr:MULTISPECIES: thioredoxin domain-containing protein [unclassified Streptomyces]MCX4460663.1 thioredoxin [Streptomyces sp. NBC_01719]MCX4500007.1 thioredoxin [Streptomyces sp. NBC_01728]WSI45114.1 thioredoxin [Streptomyces sp. NBC_01340]